MYVNYSGCSPETIISVILILDILAYRNRSYSSNYDVLCQHCLNLLFCFTNMPKCFVVFQFPFRFFLVCVSITLFLSVSFVFIYVSYFQHIPYNKLRDIEIHRGSLHEPHGTCNVGQITLWNPITLEEVYGWVLDVADPNN